MACAPCARARQALAAAGRHAVAGRMPEAAAKVTEMNAALHQKVEALRVRMRLRRRSN